MNQQEIFDILNVRLLNVICDLVLDYAAPQPFVGKQRGHDFQLYLSLQPILTHKKPQNSRKYLPLSDLKYLGTRKKMAIGYVVNHLDRFSDYPKFATGL